MHERAIEEKMTEENIKLNEINMLKGEIKKLKKKYSKTVLSLKSEDIKQLGKVQIKKKNSVILDSWCPKEKAFIDMCNPLKVMTTYNESEGVHKVSPNSKSPVIKRKPILLSPMYANDSTNQLIQTEITRSQTPNPDILENKKIPTKLLIEFCNK